MEETIGNLEATPTEEEVESEVFSSSDGFFEALEEGFALMQFAR